MEVSFKASKVGITTVSRRKLLSQVFSQKQVSLIKFNLDSKNDRNVLKKLSTSWSCSFAGSIYDGVKDGTASEVYGLTIQKDSFCKLDAHKILGLAEIVDQGDGGICLEYLQIKPKYQYEKRFKPRKLIGAGSGIVDYLKKISRVSYIKTNPVFSAIDFYEKLGFVSSEQENGELIWKKDVNKVL